MSCHDTTDLQESQWSFCLEFKSVYFAPAAFHLSSLLVWIFLPCWLWCCILMEQYWPIPRGSCVQVYRGTEGSEGISAHPITLLLVGCLQVTAHNFIPAIFYCCITAERARIQRNSANTLSIITYRFIPTAYRTITLMCFLKVLREGGLSC